MTKWSGLAPAVDSHFERWQQAQRGMVAVRAASKINADGTMRIKENAPESVVRAAVNAEWVQTWAVFAMSYGIPDKDGRPQASVRINDGSTISGREQMESNQVAIEQGFYLCHREHRMLSQAISHYVSAEVIDLVSEAADLAENEPLFHTDLFTPSGFAVMEKPIIFDDLDPHSGKPHPTIKVAIRAIGWCYEPSIYSIKAQQFLSGISVFFYTTQEDYSTFYDSASAAGFTPPFDVDQVAQGFIPLEVLPWCFGQNWGTREDIEYVPGTVPEPVGAQRRWFLTFMRFMWQEIIIRHAQRPDRAQRRRWERAGRKDQEFTVLRLRRVTDPFYRSEGTGVGLDKRVKVRGHWRRQYFPSLGYARNNDGTMNPESHRLIWVDEHWRGPEDAPLGAMHSATSVVR